MFCKKLFSVLCWILEIMIILKVLFELVMFVWGVATGNPPVGIFQPGVVYGSFLGVLLLLQEIGSSIFAFVVVAVLKTLGSGCCSTSPVKHHK